MQRDPFLEVIFLLVYCGKKSLFSEQLKHISFMSVRPFGGDTFSHSLSLSAFPASAQPPAQLSFPPDRQGCASSPQGAVEYFPPPLRHPVGIRVETV